jgi:aspartyl protease family protein
MTGDQTAELVAAGMMLVLVGSSLIARRLPVAQLVRLSLSWLLIFGAILIGYSYRAELLGVAERVLGDLAGERGRTSGGTLRIQMAEDGHFWVRATVDGHPARFLIDSGATRTALSVATARAAGIEVETGGFPVVIATANGRVEARRARIAELRMGPIVSEDLGALVAPAFGETNVIGMNLLSRLDSWRVEGRTLVLVPKRPRD